MTESWFDPVWIVLVVISIGALATGVGMIFKAFSFHSQYVLSGVLCALATAIFTAGGLLIPLWVLSGTTAPKAHLLADLMMYGISGLVVIGILCFIVDHLLERPNFLMFAAGACFAILLYPWIYLAATGTLNDKFGITIGQPKPEVPYGLDPLSSDRATLVGVDEEVPTTIDELSVENTTDEESNDVGGADELSKHANTDATNDTTIASSNASDSDSPAQGGLKRSGKDWLYDDP